MSDMTKSCGSNHIAHLPGVSTYTWDSTTDSVTLSVGAQRLLGVSGPISTVDFFDRVHPDDRLKFVAKSVSFMETGGELTQEFRFLHSDGTVRHIISHACLERLQSTEQDRISGIFIDVTHSREHDVGQIEHCEENFGFYEYDVASGTSTWSPGLQRMLLTSSVSPITADAIHESIHPEDRQWVAVLHKSMRDSCRESGVLAEPHEQTNIPYLQDDELG